MDFDLEPGGSDSDVRVIVIGIVAVVALILAFIVAMTVVLTD